MDKICLKEVLPLVFDQRKDSQIWEKSDVAFQKGKSYIISSFSGGGKSSLLSFFYGYRSDYKGTIFFDDDNISDFSITKWQKLRAKHLSILWQDLKLFPELSVYENIQLKNTLTSYKKDEQIKTLLNRLGLEEKIYEKISKLSLGQQQRVALLRALCQDFDFLLLDEPISHLDKDTALIVSDLVREEISHRGAGLIVTSIGQDLVGDFDFRLTL